MPSAPKPFDRATAAGFLTANLFVLPGLGTFLAGEKWRGMVQMIMSLGGMSLSFCWVGSNMLLILKLKHLVVQTGGIMIIGLAGFLVFLIAWVWGLFSGQRYLREAKSAHENK